MHNREYFVELKEDLNWHMHKLHFHEYVELLLPLTEGGDFFIDNSMFPITRNTLFILKSHSLHRDSHAENADIFLRYVMHISPDFLKRISTPQTDFYNILQSQSRAIVLSEKSAGSIASLMGQLQPPGIEGFGGDVKNMMLIYQVLLEACESLLTSDPVKQDRPESYEKIMPVMEYIRACYREPLTLDDLAGRFMLNKHYLCHIFKEGSGFSVMEYVIQLRIIESQRLLRGGLSVQSAGEKCGFGSYEHFIRTFNKYTGISPKQYAKQYQRSIQMEKS